MKTDNTFLDGKGNQMIIYWFNEEHRRRSCAITSIDDIEKFGKGELFCLRIKKDMVLPSSALGKFPTEEARDKAYHDIKEALDAGVEEFDFRPGAYTR